MNQRVSLWLTLCEFVLVIRLVEWVISTSLIVTRQLTRSLSSWQSVDELSSSYVDDSSRYAGCASFSTRWVRHVTCHELITYCVLDMTLAHCVLQCVAVCCSVLQCVTVCCSVLQCVAVCCSVLQCVAVCYSVLQCVAVCYSVLLCAAVCCCVSQCVAVCCCVLQCVAARGDRKSVV